MRISRTQHAAYLEAELHAQTEEFKTKLSTAAIYLMNHSELFVGLYMKFSHNGEMIVKLPISRKTPRINEYYYCMLLPDRLRRYREWGDTTYQELISNTICGTDLNCIWHGKCEDPRFVLAGFNQVSLPFKEALEHNNNQVALVMGPKVPPFEYLSNLHEMVVSENGRGNPVLDSEFTERRFSPILLDGDADIVTVAENEFLHSDVFSLQGPPGTGKTKRIAKLCKHLCSHGKSVLVTALTNQALMSVADELKGSELMESYHVHKTSLSTDEASRFPDLTEIEEAVPIKGGLILASFYKMSKVASIADEAPLFDYVIVDEASQAYLATLAAAKYIGEKTMWVGDINQMPPISKLSDNMVKHEGFAPLIDGLKTFVRYFGSSTYQLTLTYRLGIRGAKFTGMFYNNTLKSAQSGMFNDTSVDGPIVVKLPLEIGDRSPVNAIDEALRIIGNLKDGHKKRIAILSHRVETIQAIQSAIIKEGFSGYDLIVDTVARVQGMTKDVVIYIIPNTDCMFYCLEKRLFNVATSRARDNTYIILDSEYFLYQYADSSVLDYLQRAEKGY